MVAITEFAVFALPFSVVQYVPKFFFGGLLLWFGSEIVSARAAGCKAACPVGLGRTHEEVASGCGSLFDSSGCGLDRRLTCRLTKG
eukprot:365310-Chlamydomonas_euryale.AAC.12